MVKMLLWATLGMAVTGVAFWIVSGTATVPPHPLPLVILALIFVVSPLGSFWMLYMAIRYESRPLLYVFLAFLPYFFVGYYLDRVRGKKLNDTRMRHQ